jgi:asparagine synthase (glutamine-hydrolysing)
MLLKCGHCFTTQTDTEIVLHLYEEFGADCLPMLNGQFALAIWDARRHNLFLARDRFGIAPLFYTIADGALIFASEIKALLADKRVHAEIDPLALDQVFTYWSTLSPRTVFKGIQDVPPGHWLLAQDGEITLQPYWCIQFAESKPRPFEETLDEFRALLLDATRIRLNADVPVGAYLSGGLDSSTIASIIKQHNDSPPATFSISFGDAAYDESQYQRQMADALGGDHHVVRVTDAQIGEAFREVVWHAETPLLRTAPAPMYLLSKLVRDNGYKVVLMGEGADEFLAGYDLFKEAQVRRFWARHPASELRPALLRRVYPQMEGGLYLSAFFGQGLNDANAYDFSHRPRWNTTARAKRFFSPELRGTLTERALEMLPMPFVPPQFAHWDGLQRAQYLEASVFLPQYLLLSQGDRVAMAHSVEGRFPFLDHRLVEFCNRLPSSLKLNGLTEKYLLKKLAAEFAPEGIVKRRKQPYRAPVQSAFFNGAPSEYMRDLLSPQSIRGVGLFDMAAVFGLLRKIERGLPLSESDEMALAGIVSTQLLHGQFVANFAPPAPLENVRVVTPQTAGVSA